MTIQAVEAHVSAPTRCELRLFGTLALEAGGGSVELGTPKQRALLAILALHDGRVVSTDDLIEQLWGERTPRTAAHSVQIYVSELRKMLAPVASQVRIETVRPGYRLVAPTAAVDVNAFEAAVAGARDTTELRAALELWNEHPLHEFRYDDWAQPHLARLDGLRAGAAEDFAAAALESDPRDALRWANVAADIDPYRERACELAMLARHQLGRHVEAVRGYDEFRRRLADETGLVPSPRLQDLHQRVLLHDPELGRDTDGHRPLPRVAARRSSARRFTLVAAVVTITLVAVLTSRANAPGVRDAVLFRYGPGTQIALQFDEGFATALDELGYRGRPIDPLASDTAVADALTDDLDLVILGSVENADATAAAREHPNIQFISIDSVLAEPNARSAIINTHEASFLAGAAAALTTRTDTIGFIGGVDEELIWEFAAGFAAGARTIDPAIDVRTTYLSDPSDWGAGFENAPAGEAAARELYEQGVDVIFAAAGTSGLGVFQAALDVTNETGTFRWAIGVDTDQYHTVDEMALSVDARRWRPHILTSVIKRADVVVHDLLVAHDRGQLSPGVHQFGLADGMVDISYSGGFLDGVRPTLEALREGILSGTIDVPCRPADREGRPTPERPHPCG